MALLFAACNTLPPAGSPTPAATPSPTAGGAATPTPAGEASPTAEAPGGLVTALEDVRHATVRIEAEGLVVDPEFGAVESGGQGSGFIIDSSGIVVTNNHVVTGSTRRRVYIAGDNTRSYDAVLLGASECSDLAVLQLEPRDDFRYLEWFEGAIQPTSETYYAIGYPDNVYRQDPGTINTDPAPQATAWSAAREVVEISANIIPGNSGGPLVNDEGQVLGVNYASIDVTDQSFALAATEAERIVEDLRAGLNHEWIGINGVAFDQGEISGIYVQGVQAGSPANNAGITGGMVILSLGGLSVGEGGTMDDYCSSLRNHRPNDPIDISVFTPSSNTCLTGQLNNVARPLTETRCPAGLGPTPVPPVGGGLLTHVPAVFGATCTALTPFGQATESIQCEPGGPVEVLYFDQYPSAAAMANQYDFEVENAGLTTGTGPGCSQGEETETTWSIGGVQQGRLLCYQGDNGAVMLWTHDVLLIISTAVGTSDSISDLYQWWLGDSGPN